MLEGLNASSDCDRRILVRFELSLDGTLEVTAIESKSGISKRLAIVDPLSTMKDAAGAAERLGRLPPFLVCGRCNRSPQGRRRCEPSGPCRSTQTAR